MQLSPDDGPLVTRRDEDRQGWGERGRCPRCGSGRVAHLVYGLPTRDLIESAPAWVWFPGPVVDGPDNRDCGGCGHTWVERLRGDAGIERPTG
jgi:hypothetical protein